MAKHMHKTEFEAVKRQMIEAINKCQYENDGHMVLVVSDGHSTEPTIIQFSCPAYQVFVGEMIIEDANDRLVAGVSPKPSVN